MRKKPNPTVSLLLERLKIQLYFLYEERKVSIMRDTMNVGNALSVAKTKIVNKVKNATVTQKIVAGAGMAMATIAPGFCATEVGNLLGKTYDIIFVLAKFGGGILLLLGIAKIVKVAVPDEEGNRQTANVPAIVGLLASGAILFFAKEMLNSLGINFTFDI